MWSSIYKKENLLNHFQSFHSATGYIIYHCDTCDKKFQKKDALDVHRKNVHGKTIANSKKMSESLKDKKQNAVKLESVVQETLYENTFYAMNPFNNAENALVLDTSDPVAKQSTQVGQEFIPGSKQFTLHNSKF